VRPTLRKPRLADEPTGSLDSASSEQVFQILRDLVDKDRKTVVAVTHDLGLAARTDRQIRLVDGTIASDERVGGSISGRRRAHIHFEANDKSSTASRKAPFAPLIDSKVMHRPGSRLVLGLPPAFAGVDPTYRINLLRSAFLARSPTRART
jgi:energy-coupling factor transporter ATP-binding protein EcfA2